MSKKMEDVREGVPVIGLVIIVTCRFCKRPFNCLSILLFPRICEGNYYYYSSLPYERVRRVN